MHIQVTIHKYGSLHRSNKTFPLYRTKKKKIHVEELFQNYFIFLYISMKKHFTP